MTRPGHVEGLAWRFGLVAAMLVNLKQANPVLLALVMAGLTLIALRDPAIRTTQALLQLPRMLAPAIALWAVWRWYVLQIAANSEQTFRPFESWNFDALYSMFISIRGYVAQAPLFHALMWLVAAAGLAVFFQLPRKTSEARWLAVIAATVWLGYHGFLLIIYLGVMSVSDAYGAADYWRYTPHAALLGLYAPAMALAGMRWPAWTNRQACAVTLAAVLAALCVLPLRSDFRDPPGREWQRFIRNAASEMRQMIPAGSKVVIISFSFASSFPFGVALRYDLWHLDNPKQPIAATIRWDDRDLETVTSSAARGEADYLIIHDADANMDQASDILGLPRMSHELALFAWRAGRWEPVSSWPIPAPLLRSD